jgi:elongation factor P
MIQATQLRRGMSIKHEDELFRVLETTHLTPGNKRGMVQASIRNLRTGAIFEHRFRSDDRIERAILDDTEMEFLYRDGALYHFMNNETFEQMALSDEVLGDAVPYLIPNIRLRVEMYGEQPVGIALPQTVDMAVAETEPAIKGASVSNQNKRAELETGLVVQVPPFVSEGDVIKVDTSSGSYVERVK